MTSEEALSIVCTRGVVLESGAGPETSIAEAVAGEPIRGSWWAHARGKEIFAVTRAIRSCPDVLVCRLLGGKITYVHRRLWPAMVRLAERHAGLRSRTNSRNTYLFRQARDRGNPLSSVGSRGGERAGTRS